MLWVKIKELFYAVLELFKNAWDTILGFFTYAAHFRNQERLKRAQDEHYIFREESKKRMSKWVIKERRSMDKLLSSNAIPKKMRNDMAVYHYISTVLLNKDPNWTPEQLVHHFYAYLHPSYMAYFHAWRDLKKVLRLSPKDFEREKKSYQAKYSGILDVHSRALLVLEEKKKVALEIKKKQADYQKHKRMITDKLDVEMLEMDKKVLQKRKQEAAQALDRIDSTIKSSKTIQEMSKKKGKG